MGDAVMKVWDLDKANIIQSIGLHFPSFSVLGKEIEFGKPGIYLETGTSDTFLVICCEHITELRLLEESQASQELALLNAKEEESSTGETGEKSESGLASLVGLEEEEEDKQDLTSVIKVSKIKDNLKTDAELMLDTSIASRWAPIRDIIHRRKLNKMDMNPNEEEPDFNKIPLPKYEPFKIFREPQLGAGEKTLNQLRVEKYLDTSKFKQLAKDNMPFMALEIHGL